MTDKCLQRLQDLPCDKTGVGYLRSPVRPTDTAIHLMKGQGDEFPDLTDDQYFFITLRGCNSCCETARVTARDGDTLTVERTAPCPCIESNARVSYDGSSRAYITAVTRENIINAISPLHYDCRTNTLTIDCNKLLTNSDCGCGGGSTQGARGARGEAGRDGADGVGIADMAVDNNVLSWKDTLGAWHTVGAITAARGERGERGLQGERGERGEQGAKGDPAGKIVLENVDGKYTFKLIDGEGQIHELGSFTVPKGEKGDKGEQGVRGERGAVGQFDMLERAGQLYIAGVVGETVTLRANGKPIGSRIVIPATGVWKGANPNTGSPTIIEMVHNGSVVKLGYF